MEIDSDVFTACKNKLLQFRIKELKDVLTHVGLSKQGRKQDLIDRVLALLYDEGTPGLFKNNVNGKEDLVEFIDDAYRKMHEMGAADSNSKKQNAIGSCRIQSKEDNEESHQLERKIRCPCGSNAPSGGSLIQCLDPDCNVWQHINCVIIPEKPMEKISMPSQFLCEVCRMKRADPFWETMVHLLYPVKLASSHVPDDGTNPIQSVEKTFKLTRADRDLMQKEEYGVQAWCMLFNDSVQFRVQWPQYADLQVNGIAVRTVNKPGSKLLGANGRDDGAKIALYISEGVNKISLSASDARIFCLGVRLVRRRTLQQVLGMIPKEPDGEPFEYALTRVQRCIGGGITAEKDDSDSDLEVVADSITVNLRCPMRGSRMKTAGRFRACSHMGCFDLETFVELNERSKKWQCPVCLKNYSVEDVIVDPFFNRILNMMQSCGEEINEIDMKPDGSWRVRGARQVGDLAKWHRPDGSIEVLSISESRQENVLECNTSKPGIHVDEPQSIFHSTMIQHDIEGGYCEQNIITMSSTTSGNGKDDEDSSINQDGGDQFGISNINENEVSSGLHNFEQPHADVIILSDSEDDDVSLVYPEALPIDCYANNDGYTLSAPAKLLNSYPDVASGEGSGIDYFGTSGPMVDEHNSASCSEPVNRILTSESSLNPVHHVMDSYDPHNSSLDHQFTSASGDISLAVLLPCSSVPENELPPLRNSPGESWISLKTGDTGHDGNRSNVEVHHESAGEDVLGVQNQFSCKEGSSIQKTPGESVSGLDLSVNTITPDGPFSFPPHRRSMRKRAYDAVFQDLISKEKLSP